MKHIYIFGDHSIHITLNHLDKLLTIECLCNLTKEQYKGCFDEQQITTTYKFKNMKIAYIFICYCLDNNQFKYYVNDAGKMILRLTYKQFRVVYELPYIYKS